MQRRRRRSSVERVRARRCGRRARGAASGSAAGEDRGTGQLRALQRRACVRRRRPRRRAACRGRGRAPRAGRASGTPASAAPARPRRCARRACRSWSRLSWSKPIAGSNSGMQRDEHARVAGEPQRLRGPRAEQELRELAHPVGREAAADPLARDEPHRRSPPRASARSVSSSGSRPSCETKRRPRTMPERILARSCAARPCGGRARSRSLAAAERVDELAVASRRAIALTVKSRRRMSSSTSASGRRRSRSRAGRARSSARAAAARTRSRPARARAARGRAGRAGAPTRRPATTRSSTRPCGASAARSSSWPTPGTRKSASFGLEPEQLVADGTADEVGVEAERADVLLDRLHAALRSTLARRSARGRSPRSRRARRTAAPRPRPSSAPAAWSPTCRA